MANGKTFSTKEKFMTKMNDFLEKYKGSMTAYFDAIVNHSCNPNTAHGSNVGAELAVYDLHLLHSMLFQYQDVISGLLKDKTLQGKYHFLMSIKILIVLVKSLSNCWNN